MSPVSKLTASYLNSTLSPFYRRIAKGIAKQEENSSLAITRLFQDTATNLGPKAVFARTGADLAEVSFLEILENILVYFGPSLLGEKIFRKLYSKKLSPELGKMVSKEASELLNDKKIKPEDLKKLTAAKGALALVGLVIPLVEYTLNYFKNLFTLKMFKQADFKNIANLDKDKSENTEKQKKVRKSAINHIKLAGGLIAATLALSALIATKGKNSKLLNSFSEAILAPGNKLFKNDAEKAANFNKYFSLDFSNNNGKLGLSRGQLTACVVIGGFGYFGAAKDRGKQNFLEVLFRYPLVGFYVITGSELLEKGLKSVLRKKDSYKDIIGEHLEVPKFSQLPELAQKLAQKNGTSVESEFKRLVKQKTNIVGIPFMFGLCFMGLFVAGVSRFFTQYRYNKEKQNIHNNFGCKSFDEFVK